MISKFIDERKQLWKKKVKQLGKRKNKKLVKNNITRGKLKGNKNINKIGDLKIEPWEITSEM